VPGIANKFAKEAIANKERIITLLAMFRKRFFMRSP
jgi:hypothetical protein